MNDTGLTHMAQPKNTTNMNEKLKDESYQYLIGQFRRKELLALSMSQLSPQGETSDNNI